MKRFWNWLTLTGDQYESYAPKTRRQVTATQSNHANVTYNSRLDVQITITGDIDYVLRMLPIVAKQLEAADGRLTDAA